MPDIKMVGTIVATLLIIIVAIMVYFSVVDNLEQFSEETDRFTGYTMSATSDFLGSTNKTDWGVTLGSSPNTKAECVVTCWNYSAGTDMAPVFTLSGKQVSVAADAADQFDRVNVTYTSHIATEEAGITEDAQTVFSLMPIIVMVLIASVILAYVIGFGGAGGRKGGV